MSSFSVTEKCTAVARTLHGLMKRNIVTQEKLIEHTDRLKSVCTSVRKLHESLVLVTNGYSKALIHVVNNDKALNKAVVALQLYLDSSPLGICYGDPGGCPENNLSSCSECGSTGCRPTGTTLVCPDDGSGGCLNDGSGGCEVKTGLDACGEATDGPASELIDSITTTHLQLQHAVEQTEAAARNFSQIAETFRVFDTLVVQMQEFRDCTQT